MALLELHERDHRIGGPDPLKQALLKIKVVSDLNVVVAGDNAFVDGATVDMHGLRLVRAAAFVSTASSSGDIVVQIRNVTQAADMLSDPITIDSGDFYSGISASPVVINTGTNDVNEGDLFAIDVDSAGSGAKGLLVQLVFV